MPGWFIKLSILAAVALLACYNAAFVKTSIMVTNGLMIPVWILLVNLWWILLVLAPWVWLARRGQPVRGLLLTTGALAALVIGPTLYIDQQRSRVVPDPVNSADLTPLPAAHIRSLDMQLTDDRADVHTCDPLCQQLLQGGDLDWIRMSSGPGARLPQRSVVYYRAAATACTRIDPGFPADATCLLARADDAAPADLTLHLTELGDFRTPLDQNPGLVAVTGTQELVITDMRGPPRILIQQSRTGWSEPMVGFLEPDFDIGATDVTAHGGFRLHQTFHYSGQLDLPGSLGQVGLRLAAPRDMLPFASPANLTWQHGPNLTTLPYDAPLMTTTIAAARGQPIPDGTPAQMFLRNIPGLINDPAATAKAKAARDAAAAASAAAIAGMIAPKGAVRGKQFQPNAKKGLSLKVPQLQPSADDLGVYLEKVMTSQGLDALQALNIISDMVSAAPTGSYDAYGDAFLEALPYAPGLTPLLGNFGFDPTPHLRDLWTTGADQTADTLVLRAACHADPRWAKPLAAFVNDAGHSLTPKYRDPKFFAAELQDAVLVLLHLNRPDLARGLIDAIDWDIVDGLSPMAKFGTFPAITREGLLSRVSQGAPCRT